MNRLFADRTGLSGLSKPGVHTATVISCGIVHMKCLVPEGWQHRQAWMGTCSSLTMSTGKDSKLVPILILIQTDGTNIILVSWEKERIH